MEQKVFIGRTSELFNLRNLIEKTIDGRGDSVLIKGEEGVGKKTLIEKAIAEYDNLNVLHVTPGTVVPLSSFDDAFKHLGNISPTVSLETLLDSDKIPKDTLVFTTNPLPYLERGFENVGWLSDVGSGEGAIKMELSVGENKKIVNVYRPTRIDFELLRTLNQNPNSFVVLDGLEYLINHSNKLSKVKLLVDKITERGKDNFFIPVNKDALGELYSDFEDSTNLIDPTRIKDGDKLKLIQELTPKRIFEVYKAISKEPGKKYILFTSEAKKDVEKYGLDNVYFISDSKGAFPPQRLGFEIKKVMCDFMKENKEDEVVVLTNVDKLILNRELGFSKVYDIISSIKDVAIQNGSEFIIQFNPKAFSSKRGLEYIPHTFARLFHISEFDKDVFSLRDLYLKHGEYQGMKEALRVLKARKPFLVNVENMDKIDPKSLEFLTYLLGEVGDGLSVVATSQSNEFDKLFSEVIELPPFSINETKELIKSYVKLFDVNEVDNESINKIYNVTQGNPLYILEIIKSLKETGSLKIPKDLESLVKNKLRNLSEKQEKFLYYSMILGKFDDEILTYMFNPYIERNLFDYKYLSINEDINLFIEKMNELGLLEKFESGEYELTPMLKDILLNHTSDKYKKVLHARASLVLSEKYSSNEYQLRALYHLSKLDKDEKIIEKMLTLSTNIIKTADESSKISALELLVNTFDETPYLGIDNEKKVHALEAYIKLAELYMNSDVNKSVDVLSKGRFFAYNQSIIDGSKISFSLARAKHIMGDITSAEEEYKQLISESKKDIRFNSNLGLSRIYIEKGERGLSEKHLRLAMKEKMNPEFKQGMKEYLEGIYNLSSNPKESARLLRANMNRLGGRFKDYCLVNLGVAYAMENNNELAKRYLKKAVNSKYPEVKVYALLNLGILERDDSYVKTAKKRANESGLLEGKLFEDTALKNRIFKPLYR